MPDFVHLHVHSEYSLLDGACRIDGLMEHVRSLGQQAIALTDHGNMYGAIEFYRAAKKHDLHPVIGCEVYVAPQSRFSHDYQPGEWHTHLVLLCENMEGYRNLIHMVSLGYTEGFYMKPRIDWELLQKYHGGLICLSACMAGQIPRLLTDGRYEDAKEIALQYAALFGRDRFYLELQDHGLGEQKLINRELLKMSQDTGIPLVATNDAHYLTREDAKLQDVLMAIQMGKTVDDPTRMRFQTDAFFIKSGEEMEELFPSVSEALTNTVKIADMCQLEFEFGKYHLPQFDVPQGYTAEAYLQYLCEQGFAVRYPEDKDNSKKERLSYELQMIRQMGFVDYFLIVSDFVRYAKSQGIPVGPGRGSAAGSIVAYCLGITDIDPIRYSLYFERFLNPERVSMPDIDMDFCYVRRPEVIKYVTEKYGQDHVAQIVTFGTMAARGAIRDVGRALNIPYNEVDTVAKQVPNEPHITIDRALHINPELKAQYDSNDTVHKLIDTARALEGMPRHASTHAAGVVITKEPVDTYVPLARNDEQIVTQYTMVTLEELGLLKMDFLGLRNLTVIADAEKMIQRHTSDFVMDAVPLEDEETFAMLGQGKTMGVFQLESAGITNVVTSMRPQSIEDITAVVALYRPGPMQSIPRYIECKHDPSKVQYKHPLLEPILAVTYGCMVYQEQVMEVFRKLAGYSLGKADMVRRAMSKKKLKELEKERKNFIDGNAELGIDGAVKHGVAPKVAEQIFDEILDFANYAFNKAHAVSYAVVSYRTAYLKRHYPREYMAALLTSVLDSATKVSEYIAVAREMQIAVLPPDINESYDEFSVSGMNIRFGLAALKNVGRILVKQVVLEREQNGNFSSFQDFCERMHAYDLNRRALESLIKAGAFDSLGYKRSQLMQVFGQVLDAVVQDRKRNLDGQMDLFGTAQSSRTELSLPQIPEFSQREILSMEKETTGLYLSGHPMDSYRHLAMDSRAAKIRRVLEDMSGEAQEPYFQDGMNVRLACVVTGIRMKATKSGSMMAYVTVEDESGMIELVVFPKIVQQYGGYIKEDFAILINGRIDAREDEAPKVVVLDLQPLTKETVEALLTRENPNRNALSPAKAAKKADLRLYVRIDSMTGEQFEAVKTILQENHGSMPVVLCPCDTNKRMLAPRTLWVEKSIPLVEKLRAELGASEVIVK